MGARRGAAAVRRPRTTTARRRAVKSCRTLTVTLLASQLDIDIQAMLVWLTSPFYDFCGFRSIAVNSVYKLQFFTFIYTISIVVKGRPTESVIRTPLHIHTMMLVLFFKHCNRLRDTIRYEMIYLHFTCAQKQTVYTVGSV